MAKYRRKPVVVDAIKWNGCNWNEARQFIGRGAKIVDRRIRIPTLNGNTYADEGDYIVRSVKGDVYPCDPEVFDASHDLVWEHEVQEQ